MWRHHGGTLYFSVNGGSEVSVASGNTTNLGAGSLRLGGPANYADFIIWEGFTTTDGSQTAAFATVIADMMTQLGI
jgi:hypothetical protein